MAELKRVTPKVLIARPFCPESNYTEQVAKEQKRLAHKSIE
jgi:transposase